MTYQGYVSYNCSDGRKTTHTKSGFDSVDDATRWVSNSLC